MESKKNLQFNDYFEIFILCFSVFQGAKEHLISFLLFFYFIFHSAASSASVQETGNISSHWLSFLPSQILIEVEL
jgi:hypothetical protein